MTLAVRLRRLAWEYELLARWHGERAPADPRQGTAADALVTVAIVLREVAAAFEALLEEAA